MFLICLNYIKAYSNMLSSILTRIQGVLKQKCDNVIRYFINKRKRGTDSRCLPYKTFKT